MNDRIQRLENSFVVFTTAALLISVALNNAWAMLIASIVLLFVGTFLFRKTLGRAAIETVIVGGLVAFVVAYLAFRVS